MWLPMSDRRRRVGRVYSVRLARVEKVVVRTLSVVCRGTKKILNNTLT